MPERLGAMSEMMRSKRPPPSQASSCCDDGLVGEVTLDEIDVRHRVHGQDVGGQHAALPADELAGHLRPAAGRGAQVQDAHAGLDQPVLFVELDELVRGARAIAVLLRLFDEGIVDVAAQPFAAALGPGHNARILPLPEYTGQEVSVIRITELPLPLDYPPDALRKAVLKRLQIRDADLLEVHALQAQLRRAQEEQRIRFICIVDVTVRDEAAVLERFARDAQVQPAPDTDYHPVAQAPAQLKDRPLVVGFGPCGLFAALLLAQMGFKPIVLERGRDVRRRTQDTWALWRKNILTPESNVQFGEGGAGLFSDGKLYSQIKDPKFYGRKVMHEFVRAGAPEEILYRQQAAHRHLSPHGRGREDARGDHRARRRSALREQGHRSADRGRPDRGRGARQRRDPAQPPRGAGARPQLPRHVSHAGTARGVFLEAKPFAIGFRIEHPQSLIDSARLGKFAGHPELGAADYKLVHHASNGRVGLQLLHVPRRHRGRRHVGAAARGHQWHEPVLAQRTQCQCRHCRRASTRSRTIPGGPLAGVELQEALESNAFELGGGDYCAPGQLVGDFLRGVPSTQLGEVTPSYTPGVRLGDLAPSLPGYAIEAIREALPAFGRQIRGFDRDDAVLTGVESRTSSPVRITRDRGHTAEPQRARAVSLRRRRRLCGRHSLGGSRWHQGGRGGGAEARMKFEDIKKLHQKKFREELGYFLVEGEHLVLELQKAALRDARLQRQRDLPDARLRALVEPVADARDQVHGRWRRSARRVRRRASWRVVPLFTHAAPRADERAIYLHEIQDPGNLGTILRTLAWFGNFRCLLSPDSVDVHNGKVVRASMGAIFHVPVEIDVPLAVAARALRAHRLPRSGGRRGRVPGFPRVRLLPVRQRSPRPAARGHGALARAFTIPGTGAIESLNVAATVNICLYEINRRQKPPSRRAPGARPRSRRKPIRDFRFAQRVRHRIGMPFDA